MTANEYMKSIKDNLDSVERNLEQIQCDDCISEKDNILINKNNFLTTLVWSGLLDRAKCGELARAIDLCVVEQEPCDDCISRQAVLEVLTRNRVHFVDMVMITSELKALPSVTPKPKTGHWILTDDDFVYCSECEDSYYSRPIDASWHYCPNCGAKMEVSE